RLQRVEALVRTEPGFPKRAALFSRDRSEAIVAAYARAGLSQRKWREAAGRVQRRVSAVPQTWVGGTAVATRQVNDQVRHDLTRAEEIAFPILFLFALWVFRGVVAALLPLLCGGLTIVGALLLLRLLDLTMPVSTYALNIVT